MGRALTVWEFDVGVSTHDLDPETDLMDLRQDTESERDAALTVAYRLMVEEPEKVLADLRHELFVARDAEVRALAACRQATVQLVDPHAGKGARGFRTQQGMADALGVSRPTTIRPWLDL